MQIIEKTPFSVRSAIYRLKNDDDLEFILFPMIHVGTQKFYDDVYERLCKCDVIFAEGVQSKKITLLTLSYRIVKRIKRMELVTQGEALRLSDFSDKIVNTDMRGRAFDQHWSALPLTTRMVLFLGIPIFVVYLLIFGTRQTIAENMGLDDMPGRDEILNPDSFFDEYNALLIDKRDRLLLNNINQINAKNNGKKIVGIVYGANHMRSVIRLLGKLNYRVVDSEWLMVFDM